MAAIVAVTTANTDADNIEVGDLNIIDQAGNASNGLRYLDLSFSRTRTSWTH